jgi:hypothetical protein
MITSRRNFIAALWGAAVIVPAVKLPASADLYEDLKSRWAWSETQEILQSPPLRKDHIGARRESSLTILSDSHRDLMQLNAVAARIWFLCDGRNSFDGMAQKLMRDYDTSFQACAHDLLFTLKTFKRKGLISC